MGVQSIFSKVPPKAWIWISILIAAASNSVVVKIQQLGACHPNSHGVNPISYCNLLFAGSVVAFSTLLILRPKQIRPVELREFSLREWIVTIIAASLAGGVAPILLFEALSEANVTGVVLVQTIEIPLVLLLAWILYGERSGWLAVMGGMVAFGGVFLTAWYGNKGKLAFGHGEVMAILGTVSAVLATQLSRRVMERMSPVLFGIVRNFLGYLPLCRDCSLVFRTGAFHRCLLAISLGMDPCVRLAHRGCGAVVLVPWNQFCLRR